MVARKLPTLWESNGCCGSYLQLADNLFVEVFGADIDTHCDQIASIDVFFPDAPLAFLHPLYPFLLQTACFSFLLRLASFVGRFWLRAARRSKAQQAAQVASTNSISGPRSIGLGVGRGWVEGRRSQRPMAVTAGSAISRLFGVGIAHDGSGLGKQNNAISVC